jgi:lipoate-protein ligase A
MPRPPAASSTFLVEELDVDPATAHARDLPADGRRRLTIIRPTGSAVVIGSAQPLDAVRPGAPVVRRRGGGGAVWVEPGVAWFEVFVPAGDPAWDEDVGRAFWFAGDLVAEVLRSLTSAPLQVHRGRLEGGALGRTVCFASRGPGEIMVEGRKLVGWTQRRTRAGSRFAGIAYERWDPASLAEALAAEVPAADLATAGIGLAEVGAGSVEAVLAALVTTVTT